MALIRALWARLGRRGASLLWFGLLDSVYGLSLASPPAEARGSVSLRWVATVAPLWLWAVLWLTAGILCLVQAWTYSDRLAFTAAIAVKVAWACVFTAGSILIDLDRGYVSAVIWFAFAAFVAIIASWPEPWTPDR